MAHTFRAQCRVITVLPAFLVLSCAIYCVREVSAVPLCTGDRTVGNPGSLASISSCTKLVGDVSYWYASGVSVSFPQIREIDGTLTIRAPAGQHMHAVNFSGLLNVSGGIEIYAGENASIGQVHFPGLVFAGSLSIGGWHHWGDIDTVTVGLGSSRNASLSVGSVQIQSPHSCASVSTVRMESVSTIGNVLVPFPSLRIGGVMTIGTVLVNNASVAVAPTTPPCNGSALSIVYGIEIFVTNGGTVGAVVVGGLGYAGASPVPTSLSVMANASLSRVSSVVIVGCASQFGELRGQVSAVTSHGGSIGTIGALPSPAVQLRGFAAVGEIMIDLEDEAPFAPGFRPVIAVNDAPVNASMQVNACSGRGMFSVADERCVCWPQTFSDTSGTSAGVSGAGMTAAIGAGVSAESVAMTVNCSLVLVYSEDPDDAVSLYVPAWDTGVHSVASAHVCTPSSGGVATVWNASSAAQLEPCLVLNGSLHIQGASNFAGQSSSAFIGIGSGVVTSGQPFVQRSITHVTGDVDIVVGGIASETAGSPWHATQLSSGAGVRVILAALAVVDGTLRVEVTCGGFLLSLSAPRLTRVGHVVIGAPAMHGDIGSVVLSTAPGARLLAESVTISAGGGFTKNISDRDSSDDDDPSASSAGSSGGGKGGMGRTRRGGSDDIDPEDAPVSIYNYSTSVGSVVVGAVGRIENVTVTGGTHTNNQSISTPSVIGRVLLNSYGRSIDAASLLSLQNTSVGSGLGAERSIGAAFGMVDIRLLSNCDVGYVALAYATYARTVTLILRQNSSLEGMYVLGNTQTAGLLSGAVEIFPVLRILDNLAVSVVGHSTMHVLAIGNVTQLPQTMSLATDNSSHYGSTVINAVTFANASEAFTAVNDCGGLGLPASPSDCACFAPAQDTALSAFASGTSCLPQPRMRDQGCRSNDTVALCIAADGDADTRAIAHCQGGSAYCLDPWCPPGSDVVCSTSALDSDDGGSFADFGESGMSAESPASTSAQSTSAAMPAQPVVMATTTTMPASTTVSTSSTVPTATPAPAKGNAHMTTIGTVVGTMVVVLFIAVGCLVGMGVLTKPSAREMDGSTIVEASSVAPDNGFAMNPAFDFGQNIQPVSHASYRPSDFDQTLMDATSDGNSGAFSMAFPAMTSIGSNHVGGTSTWSSNGSIGAILTSIAQATNDSLLPDSFDGTTAGHSDDVGQHTGLTSTTINSTGAMHTMSASVASSVASGYNAQQQGVLRHVDITEWSRGVGTTDNPYSHIWRCPTDAEFPATLANDVFRPQTPVWHRDGGADLRTSQSGAFPAGSSQPPSVPTSLALGFPKTDKDDGMGDLDDITNMDLDMLLDDSPVSSHDVESIVDDLLVPTTIGHGCRSFVPAVKFGDAGALYTHVPDFMHMPPPSTASESSHERTTARAAVVRDAAIADMHRAIDWGNPAELLRIAQGRPGVQNWSDGAGATPLGYTLSRPYTSTNDSIVRTLLHINADPNITHGDGSSALMHAAASGDVASTKLLCQHGANISYVDGRGMTAIMTAAMHGNAEVLQVLLDADDAAINAADTSGRTALHWATAVGSTTCITLLMSRQRIAPSLADRRSDSVVHLMARKGSCALLKAFMSRVVDADRSKILSASSEYDGTPIDIARAKGHVEFATLLEQYMQGVDVPGNASISPPSSDGRQRQRRSRSPSAVRHAPYDKKTARRSRGATNHAHHAMPLTIPTTMTSTARKYVPSFRPASGTPSQHEREQLLLEAHSQQGVVQGVLNGMSGSNTPTMSLGLSKLPKAESPVSDVLSAASSPTDKRRIDWSADGARREYDRNRAKNQRQRMMQLEELVSQLEEENTALTEHVGKYRRQAQKLSGALLAAGSLPGMGFPALNGVHSTHVSPVMNGHVDREWV